MMIPCLNIYVALYIFMDIGEKSLFQMIRNFLRLNCIVVVRLNCIVVVRTIFFFLGEKWPTIIESNASFVMGIV